MTPPSQKLDWTSIQFLSQHNLEKTYHYSLILKLTTDKGIHHGFSTPYHPHWLCAWYDSCSTPHWTIGEKAAIQELYSAVFKKKNYRELIVLIYFSV